MDENIKKLVNASPEDNTSGLELHVLNIYADIEKQNLSKPYKAFIDRCDKYLKPRRRISVTLGFIIGFVSSVAIYLNWLSSKSYVVLLDQANIWIAFFLIGISCGLLLAIVFAVTAEIFLQEMCEKIDDLSYSDVMAELKRRARINMDLDMEALKKIQHEERIASYEEWAEEVDKRAEKLRSI